MKLYHNSQVPSHVLLEDGNTQAICILYVTISFSAFDENNRRFLRSTGNIFSVHKKSLVHHHHWNKRISHFPHIFSNSLNSTIENYIWKINFINAIYFWYGYMAWIICPSIKFNYAKDHFYDSINKLMIGGIDDYNAFFCLVQYT